MKARRLEWAALVALATIVQGASERASAQDAGGGPAYTPSVEEYTVQRGDTLWDISERLAGSPWHWPRVWSYNPEIANPHWIYPGDIVRFQPSTQPLPARAELVAGKMTLPAEQTLEQAPEPQKQAAVAEVYTVPRQALARRRTRELVTVLLTPQQLAESGTLTNAVDDKILLAPYDDVFITFPDGKRPSPGERYMVYRTVGEVRHPVTHEQFGFMTQVTGYARIQSSDDEVTRAELADTVIEVERGQLVTPLKQLPVVDRPPVPAKVPASGVIVAVEPIAQRYVGERQVVFVDLGEADRVEVGNRLVVFAEGDPLSPMSGKQPMTGIGTIMIVDVGPKMATCVVVDARRELSVGMKVRALMR